jgi:transcriptional regulator with XRE-family HTH domain
MHLLMEKQHESIGGMLRLWRQLNKRSQMDLALSVDISTKHLSFVETGKSKPSRNLVLRIADALKLPLRHRNALLVAAGYAPEFEEAAFDGPRMEIVREALQRILEKHAPYPAFVVDTAYKILMTNSGYDQMVNFFAGEKALKRHGNAIRILFAEDGMRPYVKDWPAVEHFLLGRLWEEVVSTQNSELAKLYSEFSRSRPPDHHIDVHIDNRLPVMSLVFEKKATRASFFTTITTLGTPLDLTTQELRLELLFPADEETKRLFPQQIQDGAHGKGLSSHHCPGRGL